MERRKGISLAKGPVAIVGVVMLAGGILALLFGGGTSFDANPPDGTVSGETWLGIAGNGWTWVLFAGGGLLLLLSAPMHWSAKTMALIVGVAMAAAALLVLADASGQDAFGIFAANDATTVVFAVAAAVLLFLALMPRVGRRPAAAAPGEPTATRDRRFRRRRRERAAEPAERGHTQSKT
jgi:hypothetical protein